ncbi:MAG: RNA polymerase sigma factor [Bacteroidota bacterium]|nr:RNA polymerase sigma factor [Bacteroidota bacterium]MDP3144662.1 RNA polymerase sigma factor [Bacteroidota bacterium]MDP3556998.1 RNA polymerase sigma factor [Bacteroidota bacterium]
MNLTEYNQCVDAHADGVYRFVLKQIRDKDIAKDIVQDSFEKMWRKIENIDGAKAKTYLFTTAYHTLIDYTRKNSKSARMNEVDYNQHSHNSQYSDLKEILNQGLEQLPEIQKTVLLLRDYEGYDYAEIGEITQLKESQVKVYIFRARTFLKNYIGKVEAVI